VRIVFAGTPHAAVPSLDALHADHDIVAVLTRPDAPVGRKRILTPSPVKRRAQALGLPVLEADRLRGEVLDRLEELEPEAVAVVALRDGPDGEEVALVDQYRHPVRAVLWEIPAGLLDVAGEDYLTAAQRELAEETDLRAGRWDVLVDYFTTPGGSNESLRVYLARDVSEVPAAERHDRAEEERDMTVRWVPLDEALAAVHAGRVHNPSAVVGLLATASARATGWTALRPATTPWFR